MAARKLPIETALDIVMLRVTARILIRMTAAAATVRRGLAAAAIVCAGLASTAAAAQNVVMLVNGDPITGFDIEQRSRFLQLANNKPASREEVLQELIDEKLKLQLVKRFDFSNSGIDTDVDSQVASMAHRSRKTVKEFAAQLASQGVLISTLKTRIKAQMIWTQVIRGKYQASFQFNENEILAATEGRGGESKISYDYTLQPIAFIVPRGSPETVYEQKRREAENLRGRFQNCEEGIPFTRNIPGVVIQTQIRRSTADLPPAQRDILEKTEVGKLTPPERTLQGIELYAVCVKKQSSADNSVVKREARESLYSKEFEAKAKSYLKELRDQAYCTVPEGAGHSRIIPGCLASQVVSK